MSQTHDFDPASQFCRRCRMPLRMLADDPRLEACTEENARIARARVDREDRTRAELERKMAASRAIDQEQLPRGTTWGDIRRALGFDRWPV